MFEKEGMRALAKELEEEFADVDKDEEIQFIEIDMMDNEITGDFESSGNEEVIKIARLSRDMAKEIEEASAVCDLELPVIQEIVFDAEEFALSEEEKKEKKKEQKQEDIFFEDINLSLADLVSEELNGTGNFTGTETEYLKKLGVKKIPNWLLVLASVAGVLAVLGIFFFATKPGQRILIHIAAKYAESRMNYEDGSGQESEEVIDEKDITDEELAKGDIDVINENEINLESEEGLIAEDDEVVNILLLGEEAIDAGYSRGRTDLLMIATINKHTKSYKLTSLMRDMYVTIPGYKDNKLNAAYQIGGIRLLYEVIEKNFGIRPDGYCLVGFEDFEKIIDLLGGVSVFLTQAETDYLNKTNYISKPEYRNLTAGYGGLNGNQALGYCRIREVGTETESNDFGRTLRQRTVLNALFDKYKKLGYIEIMEIISDCLPMITTDMKSDQFAKYLEMALDIGMTNVENLRLPAEGTYKMGYVRQMSVLVPNLRKNREVLHEFIYGD